MINIFKKNKNLYPPIEPFYKDLVKVDSSHEIYVEQSGSRNGMPVIFFHGGPGSCTNERHRQYFDPKFYRIILFDQRGCGKSNPKGNISQNTTQDLISDVEFIRKKFGLKKIFLFGGSWGSTLALKYALEHTDKVLGMILRGVFLASNFELDWFLRKISYFIPEKIMYQKLSTKEIISFFYDRVINGNEEEALKYANDWQNYEFNVLNIGNQIKNESKVKSFSRDIIPSIRVQLHYLKNNCFLRDGEILRLASIIKARTIIIQGRLDMVCPPISAYKLSKVLSNSELRIIENAGHLGSDPNLAGKLRIATDDIRDNSSYEH